MIDYSKTDYVFQADNLEILKSIPSGSVQLVYIDPPFNTGKTQKRESIRTVRSETGERKGFKGQSYESIRESVTSYKDSFTDYCLLYTSDAADE